MPMYTPTFLLQKAAKNKDSFRR